MFMFNKHCSWLLLLLTVLLGSQMVAQAAEESIEAPQYVGAKRCGVCHKGKEYNFLYERWGISAHANAYDILPEEGRLLAKCLGCHTTGYWERDKWYGRLTPAEMRGVQCEACHGPGSLYRKPLVMNRKLQRQNPKQQRQKKLLAGLATPTKETCLKCHNEKCPNYKPLKINKPLVEIVHPEPHFLDRYGQGPGP